MHALGRHIRERMDAREMTVAQVAKAAGISRQRVYGVSTQEQDCRDLATHLGWRIVSVHTDNDISAYSGKRRPGYQDLLGEIRAGAIGAVLAWHTDRLHRAPVELEEYVAASEQHRVTTQTVKAGHIDLATPSGRLVARQLGAVARYEVEHMIERQKRAKQRSAEAGLWRGGRRPYGYASDGVTVVESEAEHIRQATADLLAGAPLRGLVREWNDADRRTTMGNQWAFNSLRTTLLRPRNAGLMESGGQIIGRASWDAIVPESQWRALVDYLNAPGRRTNTANTARKWLGSGLYLCQCGTRVICSSANGAPTYRCRECWLSRAQAAVDDCVEQAMVARLRMPDAGGILSGQVDTTRRDLEHESGELRSRLDSLATMFAGGLIDAQQLAEGSRALNARLEEVRAEVDRMYERTALASVMRENDPGSAWLTLPLARKRAVLDALLTVTLLPDRRGRPHGWQPGQPYFRPESLSLVWK